MWWRQEPREQQPAAEPAARTSVNPANNVERGGNEAAPRQRRVLEELLLLCWRNSQCSHLGVPVRADVFQRHAAQGLEPARGGHAQVRLCVARRQWHTERQLSSVVAIHNTVNERAWHEVLAWEAVHGPSPPRLLRFVGRPQDYSPKARLLNLLGYKLPFDRHDWVVLRDGREVRYVIDFYNAAPAPGTPVGMYLDVRPALDSPSALLDRLRMQYRWLTSQQPSKPAGT